MLQKNLFYLVGKQKYLSILQFGLANNTHLTNHKIHYIYLNLECC